MCFSHSKQSLQSLILRFFCVSQYDDYNADTEPQTREDEYIDSIADPELLRWQKYLTCLEKGAWVRILLCRLYLTINVLSSHYPVHLVTPRKHCADNELSRITIYIYTRAGPLATAYYIYLWLARPTSLAPHGATCRYSSPFLHSCTST